MARGKGPEFTCFFRPIVEALKEKGGSGTTSEMIDRAIEILGGQLCPGLMPRLYGNGQPHAMKHIKKTS